MKKFRFPLDTVLDYKQQIFTAFQSEYGAALAKVRQQEEILEAVQLQYATYNEEYRRQQAVGISVADALLRQAAIRVLDEEIRRAVDSLTDLRQEAEAKRLEMVEAKKDTASIEKLREKKLDIYRKALQKSEEAFIDELTSASRFAALSRSF